MPNCQVFYILDENLQICQSEKTGIWTAGYFYKTNKDKGGKIEVPFDTSQTRWKAILIDDDYSELAEIERLTDNYSFKCDFIVPLECLIVGNQASILLKPTLYLNGKAVSLSKLNNIKVNLTINYVTGSS